jgi:hypothetical protein
MGDAGFSYTPIALDEALGLGRALAAGGRSWHIHVLSPSCRYNPLDEGYALLIEDSGQGITYLARSDGFPHVDKDLVRLLHGDDILDESKAGEALADDERAFLDRVRAIDNGGTTTCISLIACLTPSRVIGRLPLNKWARHRFIANSTESLLLFFGRSSCYTLKISTIEALLCKT